MESLAVPLAVGFKSALGYTSYTVGKKVQKDKERRNKAQRERWRQYDKTYRKHAR